VIKLRALIVDDSSVYRQIMTSILESITGLQISATAKNGQEGIDLVRQKHFDVVFLDVEMPVKDGLQTMKELRRIDPKLPVIMVSGTNRQTTDITIRALEAGAYDFIPKPDTSSSESSRMELRQAIMPIVRSLLWTKSQSTSVRPVSGTVPKASLSQSLQISPVEASSTPSVEPSSLSSVQSPNNEQSAIDRPGKVDDVPKKHNLNTKEANSLTSNTSVLKKSTMASPTKQLFKSTVMETPTKPLVSVATGTGTTGPSLKLFRPKLLVIGVSTGGPAALMELIPKLEGKLGIPILIVQHMPPNFTASLAASLNDKSKLTVKEGEQQETLKPDTVYIAPGGHHMEVCFDPVKKNSMMLKINQNPPVQNCRPSVDVLFSSAAKNLGRTQILSLIMTGMGSDGADGVAALKSQGQTYCVTQAASSCVVYGMPKAVDDAGLSDQQIPLSTLADTLNRIILGKATIAAKA
jgi:two-component system, chemotaxis family, protein-glutamate methylesterase/glutaminase